MSEDMEELAEGYEAPTHIISAVLPEPDPLTPEQQAREDCALAGCDQCLFGGTCKR